MTRVALHTHKDTPKSFWERMAMTHGEDYENRPCTAGGKLHQVDPVALEEADRDGGHVVCQACGKSIERGPRNLEFRGEIAP